MSQIRRTPLIDEWSGWLASAESLALVWRSALAQCQAQAQNHRALQGAVQNYTESMRTQRELDVVLPGFNVALDIVVDERKRYTDNGTGRHRQRSRPALRAHPS